MITEDFNGYTIGQTLGGLNGGVGWTTAWSGSSGQIGTGITGNGFA